MENKSLRYATYHWDWNLPFSLMTHGTEQHISRRNKMFLDEYCKLHKIKPTLKFTDQYPEKHDNLDALPGLAEVRLAAHELKFDVLIILRFSEISKSITGLYERVNELQKSNVSITCIREPFTTHFNDGRLIICPIEPTDAEKYANTTR
jgi:DNA invertase Pin-like site-specific DNA recombinase